MNMEGHAARRAISAITEGVRSWGTTTEVSPIYDGNRPIGVWVTVQMGDGSKSSVRFDVTAVSKPATLMAAPGRRTR